MLNHCDTIEVPDHSRIAKLLQTFLPVWDKPAHESSQLSLAHIGANLNRDQIHQAIIQKASEVKKKLKLFVTTLLAPLANLAQGLLARVAPPRTRPQPGPGPGKR